jgi:hypothetical protein
MSAASSTIWTGTAVQCVPHNLDPTISELPSWFLLRLCAALDREIAEAGLKRPWRLYQNYAFDIVTLRYGKVDDGVMQYS